MVFDTIGASGTERSGAGMLAGAVASDSDSFSSDPQATNSKKTAERANPNTKKFLDKFIARILFLQ